MQQAFLLLGKLVRAQGALIGDPGAITRQRRIAELSLQRDLFDHVQLQGEKNQLRRDRRRRFLDRLVEAGDLRIAHIAGISELCIAGDARQRLLDRLVVGDGPAKGRAVEIGEPALMALAKSSGVGAAGL